jgi:phosphoserine phosphatase
MTCTYNKPLVKWLEQQREAGFKLVLATASDMRIARAVADHLGIFDEVIGTESHNLSSHRKQAALIERFGEKGYAYIGNSSADLPVWRSASAIHVANPERGVLSAARKLGHIGEIFDDRPAYVRTVLKALRVHQWAKNTLLSFLCWHRIAFLNCPCCGTV